MLSKRILLILISTAEIFFTSFGARASETSVMGLPYSNQWTYDRTGSYLYVSYSSARLSSDTLSIRDYKSTFNGEEFRYPSLEYFSRLISFEQPEAESFLKDFSLWGKYALSVASRSGSLSAPGIDSSLEHSSLLIMSAKLGASIAYERFPRFVPYVGMQISPFYYRNTSDISAAEQQGENFTYGPILGVHAPVLFNGKGSLLAEFSRTMAPQASGQVYGSSSGFTAGIGLVF